MIFNAIIIPLLIPIALKGVTYRPVGADALLRRNLLIWGLGGVIVPFVGIKLIDLVLVGIHATWFVACSFRKKDEFHASPSACESLAARC